MRTKYVLKNSIYSLLNFGVVFWLGMINRKIISVYLGTEYLGYGGLFSDVFMIMSLANLGIPNIVIYHLYREIADENELRICKIMTIFRCFYWGIGILLGVIGICLSVFLPAIVKDATLPWRSVYMIYGINLLDVVMGYFGSYRRTLFAAYQRNYECQKVDTIVNCAGQIAKVLVLAVSQNYYIFLMISVIQTMAINYILSKRARKCFPNVKRVGVCTEDIKEFHFLKDTFNFLLHKISNIIYNGTDNLLITAILGISAVGIFSNYMAIKNGIWNIISKVFGSLQNSLGNLIYEDKDKSYQIFRAFSLLGFLGGSCISCTILCTFQPFIQLWFGKEYLLEFRAVAMISLNLYLCSISEIAYYFRNTIGNYEADRNWMLLSACVNLLISILLINEFGISGVLIGTNVGLIFIWYGRIKVVFNCIFTENIGKYFVKETICLGLMLMETTVCFCLCYFIPCTWPGIFVRIIICMMFPAVINVFIFKGYDSFTIILFYMRQIYEIILGRGK